MDVDRINSVQDVLRVVLVLRVPKGHLANGDRDAHVGELLLRRLDLLSEVFGGDGAVEERLGAELNDARDELCLRVGLERLEEVIASLHPGLVLRSVEAELDDGWPQSESSTYSKQHTESHSPRSGRVHPTRYPKQRQRRRR